MYRIPRQHNEVAQTALLVAELKHEPDLAVRFRVRHIRNSWDDVVAYGNRIRSWKRHRRTQHRMEVYG